MRMGLETILSQLLEGTLPPSSADRIIHTAIGHARGYLRWLIWHRNYSLVPLGLSVDDLACDAIAELLSEIDGERMERLRRALREVASGDDAGIPLEAAFKAVVLRTVRLNLARVFTEMQPVRARLLRSLRRTVQASTRLVRFDGVDGYWYALAGHEPLLQLPAAPLDMLRGMGASPRLQVQPAVAVLECLLVTLRDFPFLRQAVSENDVLDLTIELLQTDQMAALPVETPEDGGGFDTVVLEQETLAALASLREWVRESYVRRGKLTTGEAEAMLLAAEEYIHDLARSEEHGHYHYLHRLLPDLGHAEYRARYRSMYEYILRTLFTTARIRLQLFSEEQEDSAQERKNETA